MDNDPKPESWRPVVSVVRVLLVDDNPDDRALVARELTKAFPGLDVLQAWDQAGLDRMLHADAFDLVITDYQLHWSDGLTVLRTIKSRWPDCPVIMFTGTGTEEIAVEAMKAGLDDYVVKSVRHFGRLPAAVGLAVARAQERRQARAAESRYRALVDSVPVGLYRTTPAGQILDANPALIEMLGYPDRESLLKVNVADLLEEPGQRANWLEVTERDGVARDIELRLRRRDGQIIFALDGARLVRGHDGAALYYEGSLTDVTSRRVAETERDRQRRMLQVMLRTTPDIVLFKDTDSVFQEVSDAYCWIRQKTRDELIGSTDFDFFSPERAQSFRNEEVHVMSTGERLVAEHELDTPAGKRWFEAIKMPLREENGLVVGLLSMERDITERKQASEAVRESEARFRAVYEGAVIGIAVVDLAGRLIECNRARGGMLGFSPDELRGTHFSEFTHPDDRAVELQLFAELASGKRDHYQMDKRSLHRDGQITWAHLATSLVRDAAGSPQFVIGMTEDITEHRRAEEALRTSEEMFRLLAEKAQDFIYRIDLKPSRHFEYVSPSVERITGFTPEEFYADPNMGFAHIYAEDRPAFEAFVRDPGSHPQTTIMRWVHRNGGIVWTEARTVLICDDDGELMALEGIVRDVTERKRLEDQFLQAQKMETVGRMAGGVAHDFNNLLTAITGFAQFAWNALSAVDPVRADIDQVLKAAQRATVLTQRLLTFSRRHILSTRPIDLNGLILDLDTMLRRLIGADVELVTIPMNEPAIISADPGQIEQALVNLVVNARDAMPNGGKLTISTAGVTLDEAFVRAHVGARRGPFVRLQITDTGSGMSAEVKSHLFEPFYTTKGVGKGTGLGLAAVYGIVQQHRGYVWVDSELGRGTSVDIYLPLSTDLGEKLPRRDDVGYLPRGAETVLSVEDEPLVRGLTVRILQDLGYHVLEAANGHEALDIARQQLGPIDLLLTDVVMPQMSGKVLAKQLRLIRPEVRVLFTSGYIDSTMTDAADLAASGGFLQKPFSEAALARKVRDILDG
jgi:two-component system, cell cycle sensor histidine kinase and response regulator CckA